MNKDFKNRMAKFCAIIPNISKGSYYDVAMTIFSDFTEEDMEKQNQVPELIVDINLPRRAINILHNCGLTKVSDLLRCGVVDLLRLPNFGRRTLTETKRALAAYGLKLHHEYNSVFDYPSYKMAAGKDS